MWIACRGVLSPEGVGAPGGPGCPRWCRDEALSWCSLAQLLGAIPRVGSSAAGTWRELWDPAVGSSCSLPRPCPAGVIPYMAYVTCQKPPKVLKNRSGALDCGHFSISVITAIHFPFTVH